MRARVLAPLVAALVGIAAGTSTALVTVDPSDGERDREQTTVDPLGLGIPMVRLECAPNHGVLVLAYGETSGSLRGGMAGNGDLGLSYVDTANSCDTKFGPERFETEPPYALVAGPYADLEEPCTLRMTPQHRGDSVSALRDGNEITVKCVCVLDESAAPVLRPGMTASEDDAVWIRSLQQMLVDRQDLDKDQVTGVYDRATEARVRDIQTASTMPVTGIMDEPTWKLFQHRTCGLYDF